MPNTRPDTEFVGGVCSACIAYKQRPTVNWEARAVELKQLLDKHHGECIVPSSGGKDSTYQVVKLKEMGARVIAVTATTCMLTSIGRRNIDNLAAIADRTIEVTPNRRVRAGLNRLGLELVGDISWPEHVSIFTTPFRVAVDIDVPLIIYGENPQREYGGPMSQIDTREMTQRWVSEFGGFLGLRPQDLIQRTRTAKDMAEYMMPKVADIARIGVEAHFLGQYLPWSSRGNAEISAQNGFYHPSFHPSTGNWWPFENLDNEMTGLHDWFMWLKYGYSRSTAQLSVDVRTGFLSREQAEEYLVDYGGHFPTRYIERYWNEILDYIGLSQHNFRALEAQWRAGAPDHSRPSG